MPLMYQVAKTSDNLLVDLAAIRMEKLRAISKGMGGPAQLARATGRDESQISQIIGKNPTRKIGPALARDLETELGLESLSLDRPDGHSEAVEQAISILRDMTIDDQVKAVEVLKALAKAS